MKGIKDIKRDVINGYMITKQEAIEIYNSDYDELLESANEIRKEMQGDSFDVCTIINGKSGRCSENCRYCAQSIHFDTNIEEYPLLDTKQIVDAAISNYNGGVLRFSIVTSGRNLNDTEVESLCKTYKSIKESCNIDICGSHGLLSLKQFEKLKMSGITRYHNNLETSRSFFKNICTTHTYDEKINAIKNAQSVGLEVCSGGILGLGETIDDRIDMIMDIVSLGVRSIPVNILNPIKGTPLENQKMLSQEEVLRSIAMFRFIAPFASIRLAGGRALLEDKGKRAFSSGVNAAISGDMLTTLGISLNEDLNMIKSCGYNIEKIY